MPASNTHHPQPLAKKSATSTAPPQSLQPLHEFYASGGLSEREFVFCRILLYEQQLDAGEHPDVYPPPSRAGDHETSGDHPSVLDLLDANLALGVARYLSLSPWAYTSADVVNGCVAYALDHAFDALAKDLDSKVPSDDGFVDNGWGYVEESICEAARRRNGDQPVQEKDTSNRRVVRLEPTPRTHTVSVTNLGEHGQPADVKLSDAELARIENHAREHGLDFAEAFNAALRLGLDFFVNPQQTEAGDDDTPLEIVDLRGSPAADRPDAALCAAGAVEPVDEEPTPTPPKLEDGDDAVRDGKEGR